MPTGFTEGEQKWLAELGTLRQVVRQELVGRQLADHLPAPPARVLDVGCGQGTQLLRLARLGYRVTGLDASSDMLAELSRNLAAEEDDVRERVRVVSGDAQAVLASFWSASFEAVLCHGVLMYLADPDPLLRSLAEVVRAGGLVSLLVRNGDALAMRPGLDGDWPTALRAFDDVGYENRIGVRARADRLAELTQRLAVHDLSVRAWYGVRVFTDTLPSDEAPPEAAELDELLACEERAGRTDPYRGVAALTHVIAERAAI